MSDAIERCEHLANEMAANCPSIEDAEARQHLERDAADLRELIELAKAARFADAMAGCDMVDADDMEGATYVVELAKRAVPEGFKIVCRSCYWEDGHHGGDCPMLAAQPAGKQEGR